MSNAVAPPREVKRASLVALAVAVVGAVQAINAFAESRRLADGVIKVGEYMSSAQANFRTGNLRGSLSLAVTLGVAAVVLFGLMSLLLRKGFRPARILTWICGLALLGGEVVLMAADSSAVKTGKFVTETDVTGGNSDTVAMLNNMLVPGWFPPLHYVSELLIVVGLVAVCIQLLRPAAADFFRGEPTDTVEDERVWSTSRMRSDD